MCISHELLPTEAAFERQLAQRHFHAPSKPCARQRTQQPHFRKHHLFSRRMSTPTESTFCKGFLLLAILAPSVGCASYKKSPPSTNSTNPVTVQLTPSSFTLK